MREFNKLINKEETGKNRELFKIFFNSTMPSVMRKAVCNTGSNKKIET